MVDLGDILATLLVAVLMMAVISILTCDSRKISDAGWVLYYTPDCQHCRVQLASFGCTSMFLKKVNCKTDPAGCIGINIFPTWKNSVTKQIHEGSIPANGSLQMLANAPVSS